MFTKKIAIPTCQTIRAPPTKYTPKCNDVNNNNIVHSVFSIRGLENKKNKKFERSATASYNIPINKTPKKKIFVKKLKKKTPLHSIGYNTTYCTYYSTRRRIIINRRQFFFFFFVCTRVVYSVIFILLNFTERFFHSFVFALEWLFVQNQYYIIQSPATVA